jgi:hypothetical protein
MFDFINRPLVSCIVCNKAVYTNNTTCSLKCRKAELLHDLYIDQQVTAGLAAMDANIEEECTTKCVHYCGENAPCSEECRIAAMENHLDGT